MKGRSTNSQFMLQRMTSHNCISKTLHTPYFLANSHALIKLRKHPKDLLEFAKRAVEIAIEQDEQAAINWLDSVS